jgi:hypothetical protein
MRSGGAEPYPRWEPLDIHSDPSPAAVDDPAVETAHRIADALANIAGPLFWAALVLGLMIDVVGTDWFR